MDRRGSLKVNVKGGGSSLPRPETVDAGSAVQDPMEALEDILHVRESRQTELSSVLEQLDRDPEFLRIQQKFHEVIPQDDITFSFQAVSYTVTTKDDAGQAVQRSLVRDVSGLVGPGESLAIMGASGAGKSTLLNTLAGRVNPSKVRGQILVNGVPRAGNFVRLSKYASASDHLVSTMTVKETLRYAAELQLPSNFSSLDKERVVSYTLRVLGMEICQDTMVGGGLIRGISGGQRRRLILGIELLCQPRILFLDVPTNGLDSTAASAVMSQIFDLCRHNKSNVICSIQAPSSKVFSSFTKCMFLWKGQVVYYGPPSKAEQFFSDLNHPTPSLVNPSDHYMYVINTDFEDGTRPEEVQAMIDHHHQSEEHAKLMTMLEEEPKLASSRANSLHAIRKLSPYPNNMWRQFVVLWKRANLDSVRNIANYWLRIGALIMQGLIIGTVYLDIGLQEIAVNDRIATLFFIAGFFPFLAISGVPTYLQERDVFLRERANGTYGTASYILASIFANIYWVAFMSVITSCIVYFLVGLHPGRFGYFLLIVFLLMLASEGFMAMLSSIVPEFVVGLAAASCLHSLFTLFAGFLLPKSEIGGWWVWVHYISYATYSFSGLMSNDLSGLTFQCDGSSSFPEFCNQGQSTFTGDQVLENFEITTSDQVRDPLVLLALTVAFRLISYLILRFVQTGKSNKT